MSKILIVDDDPAVINSTTDMLRAFSFEVLAASDGRKGFEIATTQSPDVIILDWMMPVYSGMQFITDFRKQGYTTPVLFLTAKSDPPDQVEALRAGADDYISKPFSVEELLARIRAASRRISLLSDRSYESSVFENGPLMIDYNSGVVCSDGKPVHLTPNEYKMLVLLSQNAGKVLTYRYITREIWGMEWENHISSLRVITTSLRKKIGKDIAREMIQTHVGIGYRMLKV